MGWGGIFGLVVQQKIWKLEPTLVQKVVQTCLLVLKLCEVAVPTSFTTSENFIKKYSFLVKLWTIFDFTLINHLFGKDFENPYQIGVIESEIENHS